MAMDRRGFLQRMAAAAAAFTAAASGRVAAAAGGDSAPAAAGPSTPRSGVDKAKPIAAAARKTTPQVAITADTSRFEKAVGDAGKQVVELLRQCRVTSLEWTSSVGELKRYRAVFEESEPSSPLTHLDTEAWRIIEKGYLTSVSVDAESDPLEVDVFGFEVYGQPKIRNAVTAEFIVKD